jgi:hypothetical protein
MTIFDVLKVCDARSVRLRICGDELRAQGNPGAVSDALREGLAQHKADLIAMLGEGIHGDLKLPDVIHYPASVPNTDQAFRAHYETQRVRAA